jgi:3-oxoacyl-[acyl-carrier protein] reductase
VSVEGKVVVVTGGSRGIGRAIVLGAVERGARVVFCARHIGEESERVQEEAKAIGGPGRVIAVRADVSREDDVEALFAAALGAFGRVDVAINNAAILRANVLVSLPCEDWDIVMATNLTGAFLVARRALRAFLARDGGGRIVSLGTLAQNGARANSCYAASKGGLVGLTRAIARQYGDRGVSANLVVTGYVETALSAGLPESARQTILDTCPARRVGLAEEIASVALFLASDRAAGFNGQAVLTSGGLIDVLL